jgi:hypothetical protein
MDPKLFINPVRDNVITQHSLQRAVIIATLATDDTEDDKII